MTATLLKASRSYGLTQSSIYFAAGENVDMRSVDRPCDTSRLRSIEPASSADIGPASESI
ncbi:MAG: hypothetical protein CMJ77_23565 [Planctomycetaceae bacterium]|nr:hypothetical protein [Planctomycetaceae bacterium]